MTDTKLLCLLGVGNDVRMDDGAGIRVVQRLSEDSDLKHRDIDFKYLNTGGFDILDEIDGYETAIIVDAADMPEKGLSPGEIIHIDDLSILDVKGSAGVSTHSIGLLRVLKYASDGNYRVPNKIEVYGIQVLETDYFSETLTPDVAKGVEKCYILVKKRILDYFGNDTSEI